MLADLHTHPLDHKYYHTLDRDYSGIILDEEDKRNIRSVVDWCCHKRMLDALALTDHDMLQAGLYAREYAALQGLPIRIVTGAECEVCDPESDRPARPVHLLCLGLESLPPYHRRTPVPQMIQMVHDMGGIVVMSHPVYYAQTFFRYCHLLDGYEYHNGEAGVFEEGKRFLETRIYEVKPYYNSDFHFEGTLPEPGNGRIIQNVLSDDWQPCRGEK